MTTATTANKPDVIGLFLDSNKRQVDQVGIRIPHAISRSGDTLTMIALAMGGPTAAFDTYAAIARVLVRERPDELVFGLDRWTRPDQGVATADCLTVSHWRDGAWRFGVIPYRHEPPLFGPIDWGNRFWSAALAAEMHPCWLQIRAAPHRESSPAMALPLAVASEGVPAHV